MFRKALNTGTAVVDIITSDINAHIANVERQPTWCCMACDPETCNKEIHPIITRPKKATQARSIRCNKRCAICGLAVSMI
jgi:hypothetical protein